MSGKTLADSSRIYGLDIMRAIAILSVVVGHASEILGPEVKRVVFSLIPDGVFLFFVLSGFLIGGILLRLLEKEGTGLRVLLDFWHRRWLRTLPAYLFMLLLLLTLYRLTMPGFDFRDKWPYFLFLQNFDHPHPDFFAEAWSLSVEEWFYLLVPAALFVAIPLTLKGPSKIVPVLALLIIVSCTILRYHRYASLNILTETDFSGHIRNQVVTRLDSLMYGLLAAYWQHFHRNSWTEKARASFGIGLVLFLLTKIAAETVFSRSVFFHCNLSFPLYALSIMLLLPHLSQIRKGSGWTYQVLTRVSLISYSLYLIHSSLVIGLILNQYLFHGQEVPETRWLRLAAFWLISIPLAEALYRFVEIPFMKLRDQSGRRAN